MSARAKMVKLSSKSAFSVASISVAQPLVMQQSESFRKRLSRTFMKDGIDQRRPAA
jgi:hypothetical protein